jgi:CDP-paratose 2-epimerase
MSIDTSTHSLFGVSKASADLLVQEFGRYFGLRTVCFRGGCLTGPGHSGTLLHGFLSYLMRCAATGDRYRVLGYKGKQVRDNIHSLDLVNAFWCFFQKPRQAEVYNIGGGRRANCSILEAIKMCEEMTERPMNWSYVENNRLGDHIWWISDLRRFQSHYPEWRITYDIHSMLVEIYDAIRQRVLA